MSDRPDPVHNSEEPWTDEQVFRDTLEAADTWIEAANILGCSKETVRKWAIHYGMTPNKWGPWRDEQHLRDAIKDAETWKEAADTLGCTTIRTVQEWAERHGIDATLGPPWQDEQQLRDALEETDTWEEAADTLDCTGPTVKKWAERHGIDDELGPSDRDRPWRDEQPLRDALEEANSWVEAANDLGCTRTTVQKWADHHGIDPFPEPKHPWRDEPQLRDALDGADTWSEAADDLGCSLKPSRSGLTATILTSSPSFRKSWTERLPSQVSRCFSVIFRSPQRGYYSSVVSARAADCSWASMASLTRDASSPASIWL